MRLLRQWEKDWFLLKSRLTPRAHDKMIKGLGQTSLYGCKGGMDYCAACLCLFFFFPSPTSTPLISLAGSINASFCPAVSGCREVVIADRRIALDFDQNSWQPPTISVIVPPRKTLVLVSDEFRVVNTHKKKPLEVGSKRQLFLSSPVSDWYSASADSAY